MKHRPFFDELLGPCRAGATRGCGYVKRVKKTTIETQNGLCRCSSKIHATGKTTPF